MSAANNMLKNKETDTSQSAGPQKGDGTVSKAMGILDLVAEHQKPVRFTHLLDQAGMPKATLHRMLRTLTGEGMLAHDPGSQTYSLGPRLIRLAHAAWSHSTLMAAAGPVLDRLAGELGETLHLAQLDNGQVLYLDKRVSAHSVNMFSSAGKVGPAYCTGVGKAMMAYLPDQQLEQVLQRQSFHRYTEHTFCTPEDLKAELANIRARGFAYDIEEHEPGIICVALPILTDDGTLYGALSVTGAKHQINLAKLEAMEPTVRAAAQQIAREAQISMTPSLNR